ncbi:hypothetical protein NDA10_004205 [Ustilago hordei]|nr:hypothetical protein NDA10_004205 [Ustilago hordei]
MAALTLSSWSSTPSNMADTRLVSFLCASPSLSILQGTNSHVALRVNAVGLATRFVTLADISPLLLIVAFAIITLIRRRARKYASQTQHSRPSFLHYFAPFVTQDDVRQYRLELLRHAQQPINHRDGHSDGIAEIDVDLQHHSTQGYSRQRRRIRRLLFVSFFQAAASTVAAGWNIVTAQQPAWLSSLSRVSAWIFIFFRLLLQPPQTPSFDLASLLFALNLLALVDLSYYLPLVHTRLNAAHFDALTLISVLLGLLNLAICIYAASICLCMPVTSGGYEAVVDLDQHIRHRTAAAHHTPSQDYDMASTYRLCPTSPEDYCSLYENLSYSWMAPIQKLALQRSLNPTDVWRLRSINDTRLLFRKFKALEPKPASRDTNKPRLLSRILRANANDILLDACFKLISVSFAYLGTYILKSILDEIQIAATHPDPRHSPPPSDDKEWSPSQKAFVYAFIGLCLTVVRFLAELQNYHHARQVGLRLRSTLVVSLFEKALKRRDLSGQTKAPALSTTAALATLSTEQDSTGHETPLSIATSSSPTLAGSDDANDRCGSSNHLVNHSQHLRPPSSASADGPPSSTAKSNLRPKRSWTDSLRSDTLKKISFDSLRSRIKDQATSRRRKCAQNLKQQEEEQGADVGKIVNMMASDVNIILRMGCDLHQLYGAPLEVTIAAIFLYKLMGWSALVGFGILVAAIPVNYVWGEIAVKKQREYSSARDGRMSLMTELIDAMRFVKIQGVEPQWEQRVTFARRNEIRKLIWSRVMTFLFELLWTVIPVLVTLVSFFFYVKVAKEELTVSTAFTAIALFTMIRSPLNAIPGFLMGGLIAMISVQRLESFLNEQEVDEAVSQLSRQRPAEIRNVYKDEDDSATGQMQQNGGAADADELSLKGCDFSWHGKETTMQPASEAQSQPGLHVEQSNFHLDDINVTFPPKQLTLITGPTGSGKSSLLAAILGEMLQSERGVVVRNKFDQQGNSRFSFASQLPWLESGKSVRDNILFGTPFDKERYDMCIYACALQDDLDSMDDGDLTRIGSHTVSGGQKARISLARALYARSDTVLLDDVLSAVDARVQNHIVEHALLGPIAKGRRVIIVTHHVHLLIDSAALVVGMRHGKISHQSSPSDLQSQGVIPSWHGREREPPSGRKEEKGASNEEGGALALGSASNADTSSGLRPDAIPSTSNDATTEATASKRPVELASGARTPRLLHQEEKRREGAVSWIFYRIYLQASSLRLWALLVLLLLLLRLSESFGQYWLKVWGEAYNSYDFESVTVLLASLPSKLPFDLPPADGHAGFYLTVYGLSGFAVILFNSSRAVCFYIASIRASQNLFTTLLANVIRAPLRWFDITPAGRIMNRFGTDMDCIDNILPQSIMNLGNNAFSMAAYFLICVVIVPAFLLPTALLVVLGPWLVRGFLACTRDMQRIEATSTSPIYGHFQQALSGIVTIRAFGAEPRLLESMLDAVDLYQSLWWAVCTMEVWLSFRSQILGGVSVFVVTLLALSGAVSPGSAGLALSSAQLLCQLAYYLVNDLKNLANSFNSLERVSEYQQMPREENDDIVARYSEIGAPAGWPSATGRIVFDKVRLRYAEDLPDVLKGVSFDVKPGEKVGIIGRTGSGKSSLASSLFRAVELSGGKIMIDDIDIKTIPLQQLRSRLSIVMQDPVLFSGTVRDNLDPFNEHDDAEVLDALSKVGLAAPLSICCDDNVQEDGLIDLSDPKADPGNETNKNCRPNMRLRLDTPVSSAGANFSAGQAQLLSLARSLLRSTRILILDEATSSTDMDTDAMVQRVIRTALKDSIVICIAHRLKSVIDYDRVIVMQDGKLVECGSPKELLSKPDSDQGAYFKNLCKHSAEYKELSASAGLTAST